MSTETGTKSWNVDLTHSSVGFSVRHMVISKVRGRFAKWSGAVALDENDLTKSSVDVHIETASIDTGVADRDGHLKSADFLDVEKFPEITFKSKRVEKLSDTHLRVTGDLAVHGVTKEVPLEVELGGVGKDPWGNTRAGFTAKTHIDRKEFGLSWNQVLEAGGLLVGERIDIDIEVEAVKAKD